MASQVIGKYANASSVTINYTDTPGTLRSILASEQIRQQ